MLENIHKKLENVKKMFEMLRKWLLTHGLVAHAKAAAEAGAALLEACSEGENVGEVRANP